MQIGIFKQDPRLLIRQLDLVPSGSDVILVSPLIDISHTITLSEELITIQCGDKENKFFIFTEEMLAKQDTLLRRLDVEGWQGILLEDDEYNLDVVLDIIKKELKCYVEEK